MKLLRTANLPHCVAENIGIEQAHHWHTTGHGPLWHWGWVLSAILVPCAIVFALAWGVSPPLDEDKYVAAVIDKHYAARASCRPRVLLVGGSSTAFGFEATTVHPCATNLGLHGGTGLRFNLFEAERLAEAGDVVVLAPEAEQFFGDTAQGNEILMQTLAYLPRSERVAFARTGVVPAIRVTVGLAQYHLLRVVEAIMGRRRSCPVPYCRALFGAQGDVQPSALPTLHEVPPKGSRLDPLQFRRGVVTMLASSVRRLRNHGVDVILLSGPLRATDARANARALDRLAIDFQKAGLILDQPAEVTWLLEDEIYNSAQHANTVGRTRLTDRLRKLLTGVDRTQ
jgi:hypothetical protein